MAFDHRQVLSLIRQQADALCDCLDGLAEPDWEKPTACTEWNVADVVAHLSSGATVQRRALDRGLQGDTSPLWTDPAERLALSRAKRDIPAAEKAADYRQGMAELLPLFERLQPEDLDRKSAWHQSGVHPIRWFFTQRLGETTFHARDIHIGLGRPAGIPEDVARVLLPAYLDRLKRLFQPGQPGDLRASIAFGGAGRIDVADGAGEYLPDGSSAGADLSLQGSAETLVLIATGRLEPKEAVAAGQLRAQGDTGLIERWREIFRPL
ncbi:MAG TPA: maleylpyruvate isomerase family mycothiol-dependent enzyme [Chloroflexota bacterium]|nr:maleylpyruvate isomerase family mycothiol-dependent enzyme [Chloroflexota bacterium]